MLCICIICMGVVLYLGMYKRRAASIAKSTMKFQHQQVLHCFSSLFCCTAQTSQSLGPLYPQELSPELFTVSRNLESAISLERTVQTQTEQPPLPRTPTLFRHSSAHSHLALFSLYVTRCANNLFAR